MGEQERPGEQGSYRPGRVTPDDNDAEGHRIKFKATPDSDRPPPDEADSEGHRFRRSIVGDDDI